MIRRIKLLFFILLLIFGVLLGIWLVQDNQDISQLVVFGLYLPPLPLGILIVVAFFLGVFLTLIATALSFTRVTQKNQRLDKKLRQLKSSGPTSQKS